jgi:hypothetical protein
MGRRFTESEVLAMTRNRREDKALKEKLFKISEEKGMYHDNLKKERKKISQLCIESRRTSGNSPCPDCQFLCEKSDHVTIRQMQRHNKPWSVTPSESTFNVLFQKNNFGSSESHKLRKRVNSVRKSTDARNESTDHDQTSDDNPCEDKQLKNHTGNLASLNENEPRIVKLQDKRPISNNDVSQCKEIRGNQSSDRVTNETNSQMRPSLLSEKSKTLERKPSVYTSSNERENRDMVPTELLGNISKRNKILSIKSDGDQKTHSESKLEKSQEVKDEDTNFGIHGQRRFININVCASENSDKELGCMEYNIDNKPLKPFTEQETMESKRLVGNNENGAHGNDERMRLPAVQELQHEDSEGTREQEYMMVYTLQSENKKSNAEKSGEQEGSGKSRLVRSQTSVDDRQIQIVDVALENDGTAAITLSHVDKQRPHTVAGGELISYSEDLDLKSLTDVDHREYLWFRGKKLHNYVKPQDRYKHDPFKMKKREKLMKKLATETPVFAEDQREQILNVELTFSKATRARLLKQLVEENSNKKQSTSSNNYEQTLNSKIEHFMKSIEDFCDKK